MTRPFHFKQFTVKQEHTAMKVGTDGVLLGAWADVGAAKNILDIGTGTGLLALIAAQRNATADIDAVEIDEVACGEARENIRNSPWSDRIEVHLKRVQDFAAAEGKRYDHIFCNPPYFAKSLQAPDPARTAARHTIQLTSDELLAAIAALLDASGKASVVIPEEQGDIFLTKAEEKGLFAARITKVHPTPDKPPKRLLIELGKNISAVEENILVIEQTGRHIYSEEYIALTKDLYLKH